MLKVFLCLRYLRKKKIVLLSVAAVALSVALLLVADSLFTGFVDGLEKADLRGMGDIQLRMQFVEEYDVLLDELEKIGDVEAASPGIWGGGLLRLESGDVHEAGIIGVDPKREARWNGLKESLLIQKDVEGELAFKAAGHPSDVAGWVGIGLVAEPDEKTDEYDLGEVRSMIGKRVVLMTSGRATSSPEDANTPGRAKLWYRWRRRVLPFRISDIFYSGMYARDNTVYLPYEEYYRLSFAQSGRVGAHFVKIQIRDGAEPTSVASAVWRVWEKFASEELGLEGKAIAESGHVLTRKENLDSLYEFYADLRRQMGILVLMFAVICSVAILLVFCILYVIVVSRQKDIAVVKSCGAGKGAVALIFIGFGGCVGLVGCALGMLFGVVVTRNINALERLVRVVFGLKVWRSSIFMFEKIPNEVCWDSAAWVGLAAVAACMVGAIVPAMTAARTEPVEILRYE